jgi:Asp-tRNA(Asn)/Glu-tRNA(Gln) amidotransferase A subunit family amidase
MPAPPRISGRALRSLAAFARTRVGARALKQVFLADLKVRELSALPEELFGDVPVDTRPLPGRSPRTAEDDGLAHAEPPWSISSATLADLYRSKKATPRDVVDAALAAARSLSTRSPSVGPITAYADYAARSEADASSARWSAGKPLGPLDGVPVVIKEHFAVRGLSTQNGSSFEAASLATDDSTIVARLRAAGAIVLGQTPMTEYGMSPLGFNPKRKMPKNPHATDRLAGGSSTGSGVAVATGVVPLAIGSDGGGSIRIPASLNGVFGIKATFGRVSRTGALFGGTVAHAGPIASSTLDLARALDVIASRDALDSQTDFAPPFEAGAHERALSRGVRGLVIGIDENEWAAASSDVAKAGREALRALEKRGAVLRDVKPKLARYAAPVGYLTIGLEAHASQRDQIRRRLVEYTHDLQITYSVLGTLDAVDVFEGMRLRSGIRVEMAALFREIDLFAMPSTATTAPRANDDEMASGFLDARALDAMCRHNFLGNLTGLPALSAPVGLDPDRLPIGLQLMGDAWDEGTVLAASAELERCGAARAERPSASVEIARRG